MAHVRESPPAICATESGTLFKNLTLSKKVFFILTPLFVLTFGFVVYLNYRFQERQVLVQAQSAASAQATSIRKTLVYMMVKNQQVDDKYLSQISEPGGEIENLQVVFHADSLHLLDEYQTVERMKKLHERESLVLRASHPQTQQVFSTGEPEWIITCDVTKHPGIPKHDDYPLASLESELPLKFWTCGKLDVVLPFRAEERCQTCHDVPQGYVLGAASMEIPFGDTIAAIRANALRSVLVFILFTAVAVGLGTLTLKRFVYSPINRLVGAADVIGSGDLSQPVSSGFDRDELGRLARSFEGMQVRLRQAQDELLQKERLSAVGQMASGIIHDFRNPMQNIATCLSLLESPRGIPEKRQREIFSYISASLDRMVRMTQEILDFSRGRMRLDLRDANVEEMLQDLLRDVSDQLRKKSITIEIHNEFRNTIRCDRDRILRALVNLVNNAEDAMPRGGSITIHVHADRSMVALSIHDTAGGIPEEIRGRIFEPFFTSGKSRGTGLGLPISKKIVEQHGGSLTFHVDEGKGTTFVVSLPLTPRGEKENSEAKNGGRNESAE